MTDPLEDAISVYLQNKTAASLRALDIALLAESLYVPVDGPVTELQNGNCDVPVICVKTESGGGAIPVFTGVGHLLKWKSAGASFVRLDGRKLLLMASGMPAIDCIVVNHCSSPRGRIPRSDFERMLAISAAE